MATRDDRELSWRLLITRCGPRLRSYLIRTHADPSQLEEMFWDVWAVCASAHDDVLRSLDPWPEVRIAARSVARDTIRRLRHESLFANLDNLESLNSVEHIPTEFADDLDGASVPFTELLHTWEERALARLSERQRQVVTRRYCTGMSDIRIAEALSISEATVRVHAKRGLDALRKYAGDSPPPRIPDDGQE